MRRGLAAAILGAGVGAGVMLAAQGQDRPGVIGQARVFVENRGGGEAVPVVVQNVLTPSPIGVTLAGTPTVAIAPASVVQARLARQQWEYRTLTLQPGQDPAAALSGPGTDGWEVAGVVPVGASGAALVLKRPR
jgi:hypothetical protein